MKEGDSTRLVAQILLCLEAVNNATAEAAVHEPDASLAAVVKSAEMQAHTAARWAGRLAGCAAGKGIWFRLTQLAMSTYHTLAKSTYLLS